MVPNRSRPPALPVRRRRAPSGPPRRSRAAWLALSAVAVVAGYAIGVAAYAAARSSGARQRAKAGGAPVTTALDMSQTQALTRAAAVGSAQARAGGDVVPSAPFLIASHGLLGWYWPVSGKLSVLHSGQGIYYGIVPEGDAGGDNAHMPKSLWVVSRPHNVGSNADAKTARRNFLLKVDASPTEDVHVSEGREELAAVPIASVFTHDAYGYANEVLVADTARGDVLRYALDALDGAASGGGRLPEDDEVKDAHVAMHLFTRKDHINTLLAGDSHALALLHSGGPSRAVLFDKECAAQASVGEARRGGRAVLARVQRRGGGLGGGSRSTHPCVTREWGSVGVQAHGLALWRDATGDEWLVTLDSRNSALGRTHAATGQRVDLWHDPKGGFLKGLALDGDVAYVGVNEKSPRESRDNPDQRVELAAISLASPPEREGGVPLLWRREVATLGMVNNLQLPLLGEDADALARRIDLLVGTGEAVAT